MSGEGRLRRETVEGFPLFVARRGPSFQTSGTPIGERRLYHRVVAGGDPGFDPALERAHA
jgi:hypothetical protein